MDGFFIVVGFALLWGAIAVWANGMASRPAKDPNSKGGGVG